jgi:transposase InsO family protein
VDTSLGGLRVRRVLDRIASERGLPEAIVLDKGPEFRGRALAAWSEEQRVCLEFIQPGKSAQNAYVECFNGRLRDECLNANRFTNARRFVRVLVRDMKVAVRELMFAHLRSQANPRLADCKPAPPQ